MIVYDVWRQGHRTSDKPGGAETPPHRVLASLSCGQDIVVLSGDAGRATAEIVAATFPLLHEAGFATASITAPLSLSVLYDAIREVLTEPVVRAQPLIVVIEHAENLLLPTVHRLVALGALRRDANPVLRFLLAGTPELWPALRGAGLAGLEQDTTAHIWLQPGPHAATSGGTGERSSIPPAPNQRSVRWNGRDGLGAFPEEGRSGRIIRIVVGLVLTVLVAGAVGSVSWVVFRPAPKLAASMPTASADERLAVLLRLQDEQIAADQIQSRNGGGLVQTRRRIDALIPSLSQAGLHRLAQANLAVAAALRSRGAATGHPPIARTMPASPGVPAASAPADDPIHVTLQYSIGAAGAAARAAQIVTQLNDQGVLADGPFALAGAAPDPHTPVEYYFAQDRPDADRMVQLLSADGIHSVLRPVTGGSLPRPGEISITIGAQDEPSPAHAVPGPKAGNQT